MKRHTPRTKVIVKMPPVMPPKKPEGESVARPSEEPARQSALGVVGGWGSTAHLRGVIQGIIEDAERKYLIANPGIRSSDLRLHHVPATVSLHTLRGVMELLSPNIPSQPTPPRI